VIASHEDKGRSPYESLRLNGMVRGAVIAYGIAATSLILSGSGVADRAAYSSKRLLTYLLVGLGLQALLFVVRRLTARYERAAGFEGQLSPLAVYLFELIVDAVTVFLFALATFRGFLQYSDAI
jgi:hypothetical protein